MKEISKPQKCILLRGDIELWLEDSFVESLKEVLFNSSQSKFIEIGDQIINTADIVGVLTPETMEDRTRRKNGQWKDKNGEWRDRGDYVCFGCGNVIPKGRKCGYC